MDSITSSHTSTCLTILGYIVLYMAHDEISRRIQTASVIPVSVLTCDHEKDDTRIAIHCRLASSNYSNISVKSPDTDVGIILLSLMGKIQSYVTFWCEKKATTSGSAGYACVDRFRCLSGIYGVTSFHRMRLSQCLSWEWEISSLDLVINHTQYKKTFTLLGKYFDVSSFLHASL